MNVIIREDILKLCWLFVSPYSIQFDSLFREDRLYFASMKQYVD